MTMLNAAAGVATTAARSNGRTIERRFMEFTLPPYLADGLG
jgi:hypothetical protein